MEGSPGHPKALCLLCVRLHSLEKGHSPLNLIYIAEKIAEIKGISTDEVIEKTTKNAKELFNL